MNASPKPGSAAVDLLWTGGWDSTFRLLQLLLQYRVPVVPHYLEDPARPSTPVELLTMARIGEHLRKAHPHTRELLRPLRIATAVDVDADDDIARALQEIRGRSYIGDQYRWLGAYCRHGRVGEMELGVHIDDKVQALLLPCSEEFEHPLGFRSMRVDPRRAGPAELALFRWFSFPLFHIDKVGMDRVAAAAGWGPVMDMTWFCHTPVRRRPCGICAPCVYTIEEGLARRVPASRRALSFFYRHLAWPLKDPLRQLRVLSQTRAADRRLRRSES